MILLGFCGILCHSFEVSRPLFKIFQRGLITLGRDSSEFLRALFSGVGLLRFFAMLGNPVRCLEILNDGLIDYLTLSEREQM